MFGDGPGHSCVNPDVEGEGREEGEEVGRLLVRLLVQDAEQDAFQDGLSNARTVDRVKGPVHHENFICMQLFF